MRVEVPLLKLEGNSLSAHDDPTRNLGDRSWEQGLKNPELHWTIAANRESP